VCGTVEAAAACAAELRTEKSLNAARQAAAKFFKSSDDEDEKLGDGRLGGLEYRPRNVMHKVKEGKYVARVHRLNAEGKKKPVYGPLRPTPAAAAEDAAQLVAAPSLEDAHREAATLRQRTSGRPTKPSSKRRPATQAVSRFLAGLTPRVRSVYSPGRPKGHGRPHANLPPRTAKSQRKGQKRPRKSPSAASTMAAAAAPAALRRRKHKSAGRKRKNAGGLTRPQLPAKQPQ